MKKNKFKLCLLISALAISMTGCTALGDKYAERGEKAFLEGDYEIALKNLNNAVKHGVKKFDKEDLYYIMGGVKFKLEDYDGSIEAYETVLKDDPNDFDSLVNLGVTYALMDEMEKAGEAYNKALLCDPKDERSVMFYVDLGHYYISTGKPVSATEYLEKAREYSSENPYTHAYLAISYAMLYKYDESDDALTKAEMLGYKQCDIVRERVNEIKNNRK